MLPLVDLRRQYLSIKGEVDDALLETVASARYVLGEEVARFEEEFAAYCGTRHCLGVSSGTVGRIMRHPFRSGQRGAPC